jgi:aromatic-L-amino-acid decarboxylase
VRETRLGARRAAALLARRLPPERFRRGERASWRARNASGEIFITHTKLDGRYVLRLAIGNARTTEDDVRRAWDVLNREAER